jgi:hypothetical protein
LGCLLFYTLIILDRSSIVKWKIMLERKRIVDNPMKVGYTEEAKRFPAVGLAPT